MAALIRKRVDELAELETRNSGKIASTGGKGIAVQFVAASNGPLEQGAVFSGSISNGGTITSKSTAMYVDDVGFLGFSGHISNSGTVRGRKITSATLTCR